MPSGSDVKRAAVALLFIALLTFWPRLGPCPAAPQPRGRDLLVSARLACPELPRLAAEQEWTRLALLLYQNHTVDLDTADEAGHTALYYAAQFGELNVAELLVGYGAAVDGLAPGGPATPLMAALAGEHAEMVALLMRLGAADPDVTSDPSSADAGGRRQLLAKDDPAVPNSCSAGGPPAMPHAETMAVGSFNIRYADNGADTAWQNRCHRVSDIVAFSRLDLVGMQEVLAEQLAHFRTLLPEFQFVGVGRDDGREAGEFAALGFRRSAFVLVETGNFWLSDTPTVPSMGWDANNMRIATFAVLTTKPAARNGPTRLVLAFNTHLDAYGPTAQVKGAELIVQQVRATALKYSKTHGHLGRPIVLLLGDMNSLPQSPPYRAITEADIFAEGKDVKASVPSGTGGKFQSGPPLCTAGCSSIHRPPLCIRSSSI
eukprot:EG_transcript_10944